MMVNLTRRQSLGILSGAIVPSTAVAAAAAAEIQAPASLPEENPALIQAYNALVAARAELYDAKGALEWLADEWKHRWPAAPEEILGSAGAQNGGSIHDNAEKDIIGRDIFRDTSSLTKRMSPSLRVKERHCFGVDTEDQIEWTIARWESRRIPSGHVRKAAEREKVLAEYRAKLDLSREYYATTARLRQEAGVEAAKKRVSDAEAVEAEVLDTISRLPASTHYGLRIKACALSNTEGFDRLVRCTGIVGEMARLVDAIIDIPRSAQS